MLKKDLYTLKNSLDELKNLTGAKFSYTLMKNKILINEELKVLDDINKSSEDYQRFELGRVELCEKYCEKDDNGKAVLYDNFYKIVDKDNFNADVLVLAEQYKDAIQAENERKKSFDALLNSETQIEFLKLNINDIPTNISVGQLEIIKDFIE
jgi:hypothetical protein